MIDLQPSAEQDEIVRSVSDFLKNELPIDRLRSPTDMNPNRDQSKWPEMGALGFFGLGLEEDLGGVGYTLVEEVLVFREMGRFLLSPACLASVLGARVAALSGNSDFAQAILSGETTVGLALQFSYDTQLPLSGDFHLVDSQNADWVFISCDAGAAIVPRSAFEDIEPVPCIDWTISLEKTRLNGFAPEFWIHAKEHDIPGRISLLAAAMLTGMAEGATTDSVEYVKVRHQFGQPLGAFQAVKHRCADMATRASAAWCQTLLAALMKQQASPDQDFQITAAKIVATDVALRNAAADIQNLGGMGFTGEQNPHLFLKRSHILDRVGGDLAWQRRRLMTMSPLGDPA